MFSLVPIACAQVGAIAGTLEYLRTLQLPPHSIGRILTCVHHQSQFPHNRSIPVGQFIVAFVAAAKLSTNLLTSLAGEYHIAKCTKATYTFVRAVMAASTHSLELQIYSLL